MGRNVFRMDFEPLALPREHLGIYKGKGKIEFYKVEYVEPIYPFRHDFGALDAGKASQAVFFKDIIKNIEKNILLELKVVPIDDVEIEVKIGEAQTRHVVGNIITKIKKKEVEKFITTDITSTGDNVVYEVTPNRVATINSIIIANNAGSDAKVYLKDDATKITPEFKVPTNDFKIIKDLNVAAKSKIVVNTDQQPISITITLKELTHEFDHTAVIYFMEDSQLAFVIHNPTKYSTSTSLVEFYGYKYYLTEVDYEPEKWTFVPLNAY